jgi:hemerythrin
VEHRTEHAALIDSAKGLQRTLVHGATPPAAEDIDFLERWLTEHIYGADMALGSYLGELM